MGDFVTCVLVVDDERDILEVTERMLAARGITALTAAGGDHALKVFRDHAGEIDCVLLDINMPGLSGEEVFVALRGIRADIPIVLCSGRYPDDIVRRLGSSAVTAVANKPYRTDELVAHITRALTWKP